MYASENYDIKSPMNISALTVNGVIAVGKKALTKSMTLNVISLYNIHFGQNKKDLSFFYLVYIKCFKEKLVHPTIMLRCRHSSRNKCKIWPLMFSLNNNCIIGDSIFVPQNNLNTLPWSLFQYDCTLQEGRFSLQL